MWNKHLKLPNLIVAQSCDMTGHMTLSSSSSLHMTLSSSVNDILSAVDSLSCLQTFMFDWLLPPSLQWSGVIGARGLEAWLWTWGRRSTFWSSVKVRPDQVSKYYRSELREQIVQGGTSVVLWPWTQWAWSEHILVWWNPLMVVVQVRV